MKIKTAAMKYEDVLALPEQKHEKPKRPGMLLRTLVRLLSAGDRFYLPEHRHGKAGRRRAVSHLNEPLELH